MKFDEFVESLSLDGFVATHRFPKKKVKRLLKAFEYYSKMHFSFAKNDYSSYLYKR